MDDSEEFLSSARAVLSDDRISLIKGVRSFQEAENALKREKFDLVLMDFAMPGINGLEGTRRIKSASNPPLVIILTLFDQPDYRKAATEAGADGFLNKGEFPQNFWDLLPVLCVKKGGTKPAPSRTVLVVDDSPTIRRMVIAVLKGIPGLEFKEAGNGLEAIERIALFPIDLIILDLNMPDMHGLDFLVFLRKQTRFEKVPVIVLTTRGDEESKKKALDFGASLYLVKPFSPEDLKGEVQNFLKM